jgi:hypothetical protein
MKITQGTFLFFSAEKNSINENEKNLNDYYFFFLIRRKIFFVVILYNKLIKLIISLDKNKAYCSLALSLFF